MTTALVEPPNVARLLRDPVRDVPVPWFVAWIDGQPDFRVIAPGRIEEAIRDSLCWMCGQRLGRFAAFLIGPMCAVNRTTAEPPCHRDCAIYAARACPFLTNPERRRRETRMPDGTVHPPGEMIRRNPGVALVWITRSFSLFSDGQGGTLIQIGAPTDTLWFAQGRDATRAEVEASIESGLPILREMAEAEGKEAIAELDRRTSVARTLMPAVAS